MALISANELKRKVLITVDNQPYVVVDVFFASPTARGAATMVRTRLRQLLTGAVQEKSFRSSEKFEEPDIELTPASFLYNDVNGFHFMDEKTYEQFTFDEAAIEADRGYLKEGVSLQVLKYNGAPVSLQLPQYVELAVVSTELGLRGDTAAGGATKIATLETGLSVRVPLFIKEGELVRVNTQTGEVAGRA
jgi:elongation factor P